MPDLQRLTTEFIDSEDRFRLAGVSADGTVVTLWLTRRLLDRLIPHLTLWLERQHADLPRADVMLQFAQQHAQSQFAPQPRVTANAGELVKAIELTPGVEQIHIRFKTGTNESASVGFAPTPLRQWLGILHQAYTLAEWPLGVWPAWMVENSNLSGVKQPAVWH